MRRIRQASWRISCRHRCDGRCRHRARSGKNRSTEKTARLLVTAEARYGFKLGSFTMPLTYRPARIQEIEQAEELVVRSINDLTERHGFGPMASLRPPQFQLFSIND